MKTPCIITLSVALLLLAIPAFGKSFLTDDNVRHIVPAQVDGAPVLYVSSLTGKVACYSPEGQHHWSASGDERGVMLELVAENIDADVSDELLAASADGHVYCWDDDGSRLWTFEPDVRGWFSELAVVGEGKNSRIFAGGNNKKLYELNSRGKLLSVTPIEGLVRKLETGDFVEAGKESLFLMTYQHDKYRWEFFGYLDPRTKEVISSIDFEDYKSTDLYRTMFNDFSVSDIDEDGRSDILIIATDYNESSSATIAALAFAINGDCQEIMKFTSPAKDKQRYAHAIGADLGPELNEIIIQFGGFRYLINRQGKLLKKYGENYGGNVYYDLAYNPKTKTLYSGGDVAGGNDIHQFNVADKDWWKLQAKTIGRIAEVKENLDHLYDQVLAFEPPMYQKKPEKPWVMVSGIDLDDAVAKMDFAEIEFVRQERWSEVFDRSEIVKAIGEDANRRDYRIQYKNTQQDLLNRAKQFEREGTSFIIWTGHVTDPFCVSLDTMLKILEVAPTTCNGFLYAEMAGSHDPRTGYFVEHYLPELTSACRKHGKAKLFFRNKNLFWAATSHMEPWDEIFFSGKYGDVLVPSTEDTSSRTQDLNLAGRVGMLLGGYVNDFSMRLIEDNATSWRPVTPSGQNTVSPFLRSGVLRAAYGARYGIIGGNRYLDDHGFNLLFALMASGVLPCGSKDSLESVGSWHLMKDLTEEQIESIESHHDVDTYSVDDDKMVISLAQMHWAGADVPDHDLSKRALGVEYRWLNFMPPMPYGMVPIVPYGSKEVLDQASIPYSVSDLNRGYVRGKWVNVEAFGKELSRVVKVGAETMPVVVTGVSWAAIRLDESHLRVILMDPEYLEPADTEANLRFNGRKPKKMVDILTGSPVRMEADSLQVEVPAGSLRFIDICY